MKNNDRYEIMDEDYYEWTIYDWNERNDHSLICSSNFKFRNTKYIW